MIFITKGGETVRSYKKRMKLFPKIREAKTKVQYEWLTERHVIRSSNKFFPLLKKLAHKANNGYNQGLYRVRHKLFQGEWMNYCELDRSFKTSRDNRLSRHDKLEEIQRCVS